MMFSPNLLIFCNIYTGSHFKHNNDNQDHGGEGTDDNTNNQRHCRRHSSFRLNLLAFLFILCFFGLEVFILLKIILLIITLNCTFLIRSISNGLPMGWRDVWKF